MTLLAFEDTASSPVGDLLDVNQRLRTASELNGAILASQSLETESKLAVLLKMLSWSQDQLDAKASYPRIDDFVSAELKTKDS